MTKRLALNDTEETLLLCGEQDSNLKMIERRFDVQIFARASTLAVRGNPRRVDQAISSLESLRHQIGERRNAPPAPAFQLNNGYIPSNGTGSENRHLSEEELSFRSATGRTVRPQTPQQRNYMEAILNSDMVMAVGPAGTGKTFLAVVCALMELNAGRVGRIVLTRPVVEAGEKLGFLPGDFHEKVNPYLKPLYDAFHVLAGPERFRLYREDETIEIVPLAYMRGRTLENAFVILDEAQNTTPEQMKMFLTRMGTRSKVVVTGDVTQIDLEFKKQSGFVHGLKVLSRVPEIKFIRFTEADIIRHELVRRILAAYDQAELKKEKAEPKKEKKDKKK